MNDAEAVFKTVDNIGKVVILKDNKPTYILLKYEEYAEVPVSVSTAKVTYTLQEAMKIV
jgi:antitoxin Phd